MITRILTRRIGDTTTTWQHVLDALDDDAVADTVAAWPPPGVAPTHGDLVRVVGDGRDDLHVWDDDRAALVTVPPPRGVASLVEWWEGEHADAREMLRACAGVDRRRLVLAACDCAETVQLFVPAGEDRPRRALDTARAWVRGEATAEQCRVAAVAARVAADELWGSVLAEYAAHAYADAASEAAGDHHAHLASLSAHALRARIPLCVLACALLGARDPLPVVTT